MDTAKDFTSFLLKFCHLVKYPQTGSQILTEAGHTTSIKKLPAKWTAHIDETATQNQQWCTYMSQLCQECIF